MSRRTDRDRRSFTASSRRIGSQELLAASRSLRFALRANPPEVLARPIGLPSPELDPARLRRKSLSSERRSGVVRGENRIGERHSNVAIAERSRSSLCPTSPIQRCSPAHKLHAVVLESHR